MAINFPNSPANGDTHTAAGTTYVYDETSSVWKRQGSSGGFDPASVSESLIPDANETYDLGSSTNKFRDLYLSGNSITLGTVELSDNGGALEVTPTGGGSAEPFATETYVTTQVNNLVDAAPGALDTLNELAAALGDDANFSTTVTNSIATKADTSSLATVATSGSYNDLSNTPTIPTNNNQLTNGAGFITAADVSTANVVEYTSTSSASVDDVVMLNSDGTVTPVEPTSYPVNSQIALSTIGSAHGDNSPHHGLGMIAHKPTDRNSGVVVYRDQNNENHTISSFTASGGSFSISSTTTVNQSSDNMKLYPFFDPFDDTKVLLLYTRFNEATCRIVDTAANGSITVGSIISLGQLGSTSNKHFEVDMVNSTAGDVKIICSVPGFVTQLTWDGTNITAGTPIATTNNGYHRFSLGQDGLFAMISGTTLRAGKVNWAGGTVSEGASLTVTDNGNQAYAVSESGKIAYAFYDGNATKISTFSIDSSTYGCALLHTSDAIDNRYNSGTPRPHDIMFAPGGESFGYSWYGSDRQNASSSDNKAILGTVASNGTITFISTPNSSVGQMYSFHPAGSANTSYRFLAASEWSNSMSQKGLVGFYSLKFNNYNPISQLRLLDFPYSESNLDVSKIHGLATSSGTTIDVTIENGIHTGLSGLTVGSKYYVLENGTLSTSPDSNNAKVGLAITSTSLALDFNDELTSADLGTYATKSYVATQTFSGSYNDLTNKPTIPTNNNQLTNGAGFITAADVPNANVVEYTSTASASVNDVMMLNTDGTVTPVEVTTTALNTNVAELNPAGGAGNNFNKWFSGHYPSDPLKVFHIYRAGSNWYSQIIEDNTYGSTHSFSGGDSGQQSYPFVSPVDESKVLWIGRDTVSAGALTFTAHLFSVDSSKNITSTTTTHDAEPDMETITDSDGETWGSTTTLSGDVKIIYDYAHSSTGSYFFNIFFEKDDIYCIRVEWDGVNAPTFGSVISVANKFNNRDCGRIKLDPNNLGRWLVSGYDGYIRVYDTDYANGTSSSTATYLNNSVDSSLNVHHADWNPKVSDQIFSLYSDVGGKANYAQYTISGSSITLVRSNYLHIAWQSTNYRTSYLQFFPNSDHMVMNYRSGTSNRASMIIQAPIAATDASGPTKSGVLTSIDNSWPLEGASFDYTSASLHGSLYYPNGSNAALRFIRAGFTASNFDSNKLHGVAASAGTTIDVTLEHGIHTGLSGLTTGSVYYTSDEGVISTTAGGGSKLGTAINATSLALDFTDELVSADLATYATKSYVASQVPSLTGYATENYVDTSVANLVDSAPATLDTLNELAAALGDDANFSTTITNQIAAKADAYSIATVTASGGNFYIDGVQQVTLSFEPGRTYRFDQADSSNGSHPLRFSTNSDGTHGGGSEYTTGVTTNGTAGSAGAYVQIAITHATPTLYYYCVNHSGMGAGSVVGNFSGNYNDLTNLPTLFDGQFSSLTGTPSLYTDSAVDTHLNISGATTGQILSWNGTDYAWIDAAAGGGSSVSVSATAPSSPSEGDLWFDEDDLVMYVWYTDGDSSQWIEANSVTAAAATIHASDTAPSGPSSGDLWFNTTLLDLYVYYADGDSNQWVQVGGAANSQTSGSGGGSSVQSLIETANTSVTTTDTGTDGHIDFTTNGTARWEITSNGHILPHTNASFDIGSAEKKVRYLFLDSNTMFVGDTSFSEDNIDRSMEVYTDQSAPSSSTDEGKKGDVRIVGNYMYVCINTNEWIRTQIEKDW
jgi:hypothetical protein